MIRVYPEHPIAKALNVLAPLLDVNFDLRSARDAEKRPIRYPLLDYVVIIEQGGEYDTTKNSWRVNMLVQFDLLFQERHFAEFCNVSKLEGDQAAQAAFWKWSGDLRKIVSLMVNPKALTNVYKEEDIIFAKYDFRLVQWIETFYHRNKGADKLTGVSSRFLLSALDADNAFCCTDDDLAGLRGIVFPDSVSDKMIVNKLNP